MTRNRDLRAEHPTRYRRVLLFLFLRHCIPQLHVLGLALTALPACADPAAPPLDGPACTGRYWMLANGHRLDVTLDAGDDGRVSGLVREGEVQTTLTGSCDLATPGEPGALSLERTGMADGGVQQFDGRYLLDPGSGQTTLEGEFGVPGGARSPFFAFTRLDDSAVTVTSAARVAELRRELIRWLWDRDDLPLERRPAAIEQDVPAPLPGLEASLARTDLLTVEMDDGFTAHVYHLHPRAPNRRLMVFHQGHSPDLGASGGARTIGFLLERGFDVLACFMPALGPNDNPLGPPGDHAFVRLDAEDVPPGHPMRFFVEPVIVALSHALDGGTFESVGMVGVSGGGWTTVVAAALDPRIEQSFSVAGSLPLATRIEDKDVGDWEQFEPAFYRLAGYPDLYVLGATGEGRGVFQVHNELDECCFARADAPAWVVDVQQAVAEVGQGGGYGFFVDPGQTEHTISDWTRDHVIGPALAGQSPAP